jgi:hypothetical protein
MNKVMNKEPLKLIQAERVKTLLACYGAEVQAWPADERSAALTLIHHSPELQALWQEAQELDRLLQSNQGEPVANPAQVSRLTARIVEQLPAQDSPRPTVTEIHQPQRRKRWPLTAAAAALLLAIGVSLQLQSPLPPSQNQPLAAAEYDQWLWQDITGEDINSDDNTTENGELTFLALVELE